MRPAAVAFFVRKGTSISYDGDLGAADTIGMPDQISELLPPVENVSGYLAFTRFRDMGGLGKAFDDAVRAMKKDGTYAAILAKYPNR